LLDEHKKRKGKLDMNWFMKVLAGLAILLVLIVATLFIVNGSYLSKKYLKPWDKPYYQQFDDPRLQVIAHGILAPNAHNMQSWRILLNDQNPNEFSLFVETGRLLPETDPYSRQITISNGTFLELVRIASEKLGYQANITLFPQGEFDDEGTAESLASHPVAKVLLELGEVKNSSFYDAIFNRVTNRTQYLDKPLAPQQIQQLRSLNPDSTLSLEIFQSGEDLNRLKEFAKQGVQIESNHSGSMHETNLVLRMSERQKNKYRYGLTMDSQGLSEVTRFFMQSLGTIFPLDEEASGRLWRTSEFQRIEHTPAYALIISADNSRISQVKSGMLYSRFQLAGTVMGLSMQPTSQVLQEYPEMAELYKEVHQTFTDAGHTIQMMVRLGEASQSVSHSPRMDVMSFIK
jgi:hypothetical protein